MGHAASSTAAPLRQHCRRDTTSWQSNERRTGKELIIHPAFASCLYESDTVVDDNNVIRALHLPEHIFRLIILHLVRLDEPRSSVQSILSLSATCTWLRYAALCLHQCIFRHVFTSYRYALVRTKHLGEDALEAKHME
jgi:hypothetical protein